MIADGSHVETEYDTTGFGYYLKEQNEDGTWKYTGLDQAPEYVLDADGAYTNEAWIVVGGNKQKVTVDETVTFIQYLKPDGQGGYTTETERTFWLFQIRSGMSTIRDHPRALTVFIIMKQQKNMR